MSMKEVGLRRLLAALRAAGPDTKTPTAELARKCAIDRRVALKLLDTLQAEGRVRSTYEYAGRHTVRVWSIVREAGP